MTKVFIKENTMTEIGNAIRTKTGKKDLILPQNMPSEIESIKVDYTELINSVLNRTVTDIYIDTPVGRYSFCNCKFIKPTFGDNCTKIGQYAFRYIESVTEINTNRVVIIESYAFDGAKNLTKANLPNVIDIGSYAFYRTPKLTKADLSHVVDINSYAFMRSGLQTIIIRSDLICALGGTNAFEETPIGKGTGYIYVPKDLLEQYKESTNWIVFANQFRAIEDYPDITGEVSLASSKTSMKNVLIDENTMISIGNAIRSKTKKEDLILPKDMPSEIQSMNTGGDTRILNGIINRTIKDIYIDTSVGDYAFYYCTFVKPTFGDNCTKIGYEPFYYCYAIEGINTNKVTEIGSYAFFGSKNLSKADLPNVIRISSDVFNWTKLETLILRSNKVCSLASGAFYGTPIEKGEGYIYVPKALIEQYKVATNWVTFANQFRAIEDYQEITGGN